jgi:hypothetical protein
MSDRLRRLLAGMAVGGALAASSPAMAQNDVPEIRIGVIDNGVSRNCVKDPNARVVPRVMHNGVQAGWTGDSYYSHGDLVAIDAVEAARAAAPDARITVLAANVYMPSDAKDLQNIRYRISHEAVRKSIDWFKAEGVRVVVFTGTSRDTQGMRDLSEQVKAAGMVLVASTNNAPSSEKVYPAAYPDTISVAGTGTGLQIGKSPMLASYVSFVTSGDAYQKQESGSSFAAGTIAGYAAAWASTSPHAGRAEIVEWLSSRGTKADYSGTSIPTLPQPRMFGTAVTTVAPDNGIDVAMLATARAAGASR